MSDQNCGSCFNSRPGDGGAILCHAGPPIPVVVKVDQAQNPPLLHTTSAWPPVPAHEWCGSWRQSKPATVTVLQPMSVVQFQRDPGDENPS